MSTRASKIIGKRDGHWLSFHGIPSQIIALGEETLSTYDASRGTSAPGSAAPPHAHTFDEGFYLLRGEVTFQAGDQSVRLAKGDFINIRGGTAHFPKNEGVEAAELLVIGAPAGFADFQLAVGERAPGPDGPFAKAPSDFLERLATAGVKFGIDLNPRPSLFQQAPEMTVRRRGEGQRVAAAGDVYTFLVTGAETGGRYALWHAVVHPGGGPPPHLHRREEEAFFILNGELALLAEGRPLTARAGDWVMLPRDSAHAFKNETDLPVEMLIMVAPAGLEAMFVETGRAWSDPWQAPPPVGPAEIARLSEVAPRFGIELLPPA